MNTKEELKDVVPKLLFSGFSSADPPSSVRSKKQVVCRMLVTTCHGRPRMTRWSEEAQAAVKAAYEKLWAAGVLHKAVADRNILFKDNVGSDEDVEVNNVRLCDFEDALLKHDLKPEKWANALEEERKALESLCERMGKAPLPEKKKKLFWTAEDIRNAKAEGRNPFE
ncbi:hypothetical protein GLOTRDRAFT_112460 [Gloeophyllum trabeum ATCC 11539]|uniref:Protein kinase domain-containing protein n=1 Tax=Gloeophyllum trabeum (strain ATCC 11539 / FP-39264 / Madison 617) TaxID=670483 RepID=S7RFB9_GLOTA|nr:uncharacterized protein GLOTRDRAFT_112460 [Gloeophyllum trabeum ATCC 11539]EPQ51204.1 hypothetical protein GLOTRDRAFT_112460 [Gloeophyllum trabeum ATCC 11539]